MGETLEVNVDLRGIRNEADVVYRFYKAFGIFGLVSEEERLRRIRDNVPANWDAFADDICCLDGSSKLVAQLVAGGKLESISVRVVSIKEVRSVLSEDARRILFDILALATDRADSQSPYDFSVILQS